MACRFVQGCLLDDEGLLPGPPLPACRSFNSSALANPISEITLLILPIGLRLRWPDISLAPWWILQQHDVFSRTCLSRQPTSYPIPKNNFAISGSTAHPAPLQIVRLCNSSRSSMKFRSTIPGQTCGLCMSSPQVRRGKPRRCHPDFTEVRSSECRFAPSYSSFPANAAGMKARCTSKTATASTILDFLNRLTEFSLVRQMDSSFLTDLKRNGSSRCPAPFSSFGICGLKGEGAHGRGHTKRLLTSNVTKQNRSCLSYRVPPNPNKGLFGWTFQSGREDLPYSMTEFLTLCLTAKSAWSAAARRPLMSWAWSGKVATPKLARRRTAAPWSRR
jgi:hypothetical protein